MEYGTLNPKVCRAHYTDFLQPGRILLTGHSHQAWPNAARAGQLLAYEHAAAHVDDKWSFAMEAADAVRGAVADGVGEGKRDCLLCVLAAHTCVYIHTSMYASIHTHACSRMHACTHTCSHISYVPPSIHTTQTDACAHATDPRGAPEPVGNKPRISPTQTDISDITPEEHQTKLS